MNQAAAEATLKRLRRGELAGIQLYRVEEEVATKRTGKQPQWGTIVPFYSNGESGS